MGTRVARSTVIGVAVVAAYAGLVAFAAVTGARHDSDRPAAERTDPAQELVEAWARSRNATFVTVGTYERRSEVTGAVIASEDYVAQHPPRRIHRQLGGVEGRDDDRILLCPAPPEDQDEVPPCRLGAPGGPTYAESVEREVEGMRSLVTGSNPLYSVARTETGCFALDLQRVDPRAPFGIEASFCFDGETGAPAGHRVRHEGGIEEAVTVTEIRSEVTDADLEP